MQGTAFSVWQNISGSGMLTAIYVLMTVFLFFYEQEKYKRILLIYLPVCWMGFLFLPITYRLIAEIIDEELYYRFFWLLPMTLVIAYGVVQLYHLYQGAYKKLAALGLATVLALSGDFVYNNWRYSMAENPYHVPQSVVDICDFIHADGREVMALFPQELIQYVRQYDSTVCMPYGRNMLVEDWNIYHPLYMVMEGEILDCKLLGESAAQHSCAYIIVETERKIIGNMVKDLSASGYEWKAKLHGYEIFYNEKIFLSIYQ